MLKALSVFHTNPRSSWIVMETLREPERFVNHVGARLSHGLITRGHGLQDGLAVIRRFRDDYVFAGLAYAAYWLSELLVLWLSRTREYWADRFALVVQFHHFPVIVYFVLVEHDVLVLANLEHKRPGAVFIADLSVLYWSEPSRLT